MDDQPDDPQQRPPTGPGRPYVWRSKLVRLTAAEHRQAGERGTGIIPGR